MISVPDQKRIHRIRMAHRHELGIQRMGGAKLLPRQHAQHHMLGAGRRQDGDTVFFRKIPQCLLPFPGCDDCHIIGAEPGRIPPLHPIVYPDQHRRHAHKPKIDIPVQHPFPDSGGTAKLFPVDLHARQLFFQKLLFLHNLKRRISDAKLLRDPDGLLLPSPAARHGRTAPATQSSLASLQIFFNSLFPPAVSSFGCQKQFLPSSATMLPYFTRRRSL